jgi:DNA-binding protein HU-beta
MVLLFNCLSEFRLKLRNLFPHALQAVADDRSVRLSKFGALESYDSPARTGRNPATGQTMLIPARKRIRFKPYTSFKKTTNGGT